MCDTQHNNASSLSTEERQRIINRIDTRISSLITPIDGNEHINSLLENFSQDVFAATLKRKHDELEISNISDTSRSKIAKPTVTKYYPINIASINVRGFNDSVKQHQILDYIKMYHLDIVGLSELRVTNGNFAKSQRFTNNNTHKFFWAINEDKSDPASGITLMMNKELAKHVQRVQRFKGRLIAADLFFRRFHRVRIIHIYVPPINQINK